MVDRIRAAVLGPVVHHELDDVGAGEIDLERGRGRSRIGKKRGATGRLTGEHPLERQRIPVDVARARPVERDGIADARRPVGSGNRRRPGVSGGNLHLIGSAVGESIVHHELDDVISGRVDDERRHWGGRVGQAGGASGRHRDERPAKGEGVAVGIRRARSVELHPVPDQGCLVGTGIGNRWRVLGRDDDRVGRTVLGAVVDDELHDVRARQIDVERRHDRRRVGDGSHAAGRHRDQRPLEGQGVAIVVERAASVQVDGVTYEHHLVGAAVGHGRCVRLGWLAGVGLDGKARLTVGRRHLPDVVEVDVTVYVDVGAETLWGRGEVLPVTAAENRDIEDVDDPVAVDVRIQILRPGEAGNEKEQERSVRLRVVEPFRSAHRDVPPENRDCRSVGEATAKDGSRDGRSVGGGS